MRPPTVRRRAADVPADEQPKGPHEGHSAALWRHAARSACGGRWIKKAATIYRTGRGGQPSGGSANYRGKCSAATAAAAAAAAVAAAAAAAAAAAGAAAGAAAAAAAAGVAAGGSAAAGAAPAAADAAAAAAAAAAATAASVAAAPAAAAK